MTDPYPNVDEFGPGACTCGGTYTGCAVCQCANILIRWGKSIPRLHDGTPDMRALGTAMGAKHRAADSRVRHGLSLQGQCTGGTNWCSYCVYLQLKAQGVPVAYGQLTWDQIAAQLRAFHPVVIPGWYGRVPVVGESSYSKTTPAKGRSDTGFDGAHMVTGWGVTGAAFIVTDSDFGSPSRPVVPPHSVWSATTLNRFYTALGWTVCYATQKPPVLNAAVWGSDIPADIRAFDPGAVKTAAKLRKLNVNWASTINQSDIREGMSRSKPVYHPGTGPLTHVDMDRWFRGLTH